MTLHATTVAIGGRGVMLLGESGLGKSDLALRLIDRGAALIADDRTEVRRERDAVSARAPAKIAGKIEVRGLGILALPHLTSARVALVVRLTHDAPRMPDPMTHAVAGVDLPLLLLDPRPASAAIKVELALARLPT